MKTVFLLFFLLILISGCKESVVQPVPEEHKPTLRIENEEYIYDAEWKAYIINKADSTLYFPCCWQPLYGIEQLINNQWHECEQAMGLCPPGSQEIRGLSALDTLLVCGRAPSPGTYRLKTVYFFDLRNYSRDTIFSNAFIVAENPVLAPPEDQDVVIRMEKEVYRRGDQWTGWVINATDTTLFFPFCTSIMVAVEQRYNEDWILFDDGAQVCLAYMSPWIWLPSKAKELVTGRIYDAYVPGQYRLVTSYWHKNPQNDTSAIRTLGIFKHI